MGIGKREYIQMGILPKETQSSKIMADRERKNIGNIVI